MTDTPKDIYESLDEMIALCQRKVELMGVLKRALRIADLLGVPPKQLKERVLTSYRQGRSVFRPWLDTVISIRVGDEPWEDFKLTDVHKDLWPADMRAAYDRYRRQERKLS